MKLEIKHLASYLPYGLKVKVGQTSIAEMTLCETSVEKIPLVRLLENSAYKPLLIRMPELFNQEYGSTGMSPTYWLEEKYGIRLQINDNGKFNLYIEDDELTLIDIWIAMDFLYCNHFDVFNLIEAGLALNKLDYIK